MPTPPQSVIHTNTGEPGVLLLFSLTILEYPPI